jgi:LytS/YehU family sensor histidine kinase
MATSRLDSPGPEVSDRPFSTILRESWGAWWAPSQARSGPAWLQYGWTFFFNTAIALVLTLIAWGFAQRGDPWQVFKWNWVIAQSIGYSIHVLFDVAGAVVGRERIEAFDTRRRAVFFAGVPIVGCLAGYWIGLTLLGVEVGPIIHGAPRVVIAILVVSIIVSTFWYRHMAGKARLAQAEAERERERTRSAELERLAVDAQLRSLQAQIEPHFLFNTLANVVSLIDASPGRARMMLERLIDLLRASLAASRSPRTTLGQECGLVSAYLDILAIRMGERLQYAIDLPPELASARLPPLSLQPLVENAIKHGLEPKLGGGRVVVRARAVDGTLRIDVEDDGLGFTRESGSGVGLQNLKERLSASYGADARLLISELAPGTRVQLTLPLET